ncbi:hypothetical protein OG562_43780 [Streptomyces sp. NBC_01275]|nr:hypothetical protein [Streptomyces sp. NBC_01275]
MHSREGLDALADLLDGTPTLVVSDEAYSDLDHTGRPFTSAIPGVTLSAPEGAFYQFRPYDVDLPSVEVVAAPRTHGIARPHRGRGRRPPRGRTARSPDRLVHPGGLTLRRTVTAYRRPVDGRTPIPVTSDG